MAANGNTNGDNQEGGMNGAAGPFGIGGSPGVRVGEIPGNPQSFGPQISQHQGQNMSKDPKDET